MRSMQLTKPLPLEPGEKEGLKFFLAPGLAAMPGLEHAFMSRTGGVSEPPYNTLNFGGEDAPARIKANMESLVRALDLPQGGVTTARQVHGSEVLVIGGNESHHVWGPDKRPSGDAIVTSEKCLPIGVLTADCVPVLFFDRVTATIAVAHAGWRGFVAGVLGETISVMGREFGVRAADIHAAIGPHIGPCCYEVSEDLVEKFRGSGRETKPYFTPGHGGRWRLDLGRAVYDELIGCGLEGRNISLPGPCTVCDERNFFSYRRDGSTGRGLSFIMMR